MPRTVLHTLVTPRDFDILQALDRTPLTARQILTLSQSFSTPFTSERKVRSRMQRLIGSGRVRQFPYAIAGRGCPSYYLLTRHGHQLLYGPDAMPTAKRAFSPIGLAHQQHAYQLAQFIVHTIVAADHAGIRLTGFCRENALHLTVGDESLYPDCAFALLTPDSREFQFFVELDNSTERVRSQKATDSVERKLRLYEAFQDRSVKRFRVLVVTTRSTERLHHILSTAADLARNKARSLVYGISLNEYLKFPHAVTLPCFLNHRGQSVSLVPKQSTPISSRRPVNLLQPLPASPALVR